MLISLLFDHLFKNDFLCFQEVAKNVIAYFATRDFPDFGFIAYLLHSAKLDINSRFTKGDRTFNLLPVLANGGIQTMTGV